MERRGGCCIASYGGGGGGGGGDCGADVAWKVGRIMLRFRPIAPKPAAPPPPPVAAGTAADGVTAGRARRKASGGGGKEGRRGRRARNVAAGGFKVGERKRRSPSSSVALSVWSGSMVTLPLMPETPERKGATPPEDVPSAPYVTPAWLREREGGADGGEGGEVVAPRPVRPAGSWVTVECVTDTWAAAAGGGGDEVVRAALEAEDVCPGFISDAWDRVMWTNEAYQRMVVGPVAEDAREEVADQEEEVRVALLTRGMVPGVTCRAFTCRVRVRYASRRRGRGSLTAPCDVWRLDDGGYAWRLDIKAALSLSLGR
ncbi:uncharacterized protein LOC103714755 [Phoenix dactylifera]|uniref:Uncharacterized protein LOC103714755 n=1 Tax=Phoenix dactylifera TaxID=42345 RepID=A0A8B7CJA7_PHODC|nr:uncharacterized protein LOC103714755 [Phoenix dactylifera]